jgi:2,3-bisphosphoglycerate-dependent phosphoglycerate mutase
MMIGHVATHRALEHVVNNATLEELTAAELSWREQGWEYLLS